MLDVLSPRRMRREKLGPKWSWLTGCAEPLKASGLALSQKGQSGGCRMSRMPGLQPRSNQARQACGFLSFPSCKIRIPSAQDAWRHSKVSKASLTVLEAVNGNVAVTRSLASQSLGASGLGEYPCAHAHAVCTSTSCCLGMLLTP